MALEIRPNAIAQDQGHFLYPGIRIGGSFLAHDHILSSSEVVFNERGVDIDFRVEASGKANALFVRGSDGNVKIGSNVDLDEGGVLDVNGALAVWEDGGSLKQFIINYGGTPQFRIHRSVGTQASPTNVTNELELGRIEWRGYDDAGFDSGPLIRAMATEDFTAIAHGARLEFWTVDNTTTGQDQRMRIDQDGGIYMYNLLAAAASTDVNINGSNELHSVTSSKRYKTKIRGLALDSSKIYDLKPRSFVWKRNSGNPGMVDFGLIAEEAYQVIPEIVNLDADEKPYSIRTGLLPVLMLAEIQKLEKRVRYLEARIA